MRAIILVIAATQLLGCSLFQSHGNDRELTVGTVQKEIRIGMSGAQTHTAPATLMLFDSLGSITTTSSNQRNSSSQRSLTVIIKFDEDSKVYDFAYHTSRF